MALTLSSCLSDLKGIGPRKAEAFQKLGIFTLNDLINHFPSRYEDRTSIKNISDTVPDEKVCIRGIVASEPRLSRIRRGLELVKFRVFDDTGMLDVTYFNQSYRKNAFSAGQEYIFFGKIECSGRRKMMTNPVCEAVDKSAQTTCRIVPVYRVSAGITQRNMASALEQTIPAVSALLDDPVPVAYSDENSLLSLADAYTFIHCPENFEQIREARKKLVYNELFLFSCALHMIQGSRTNNPGILLKGPDVELFWASLPFLPTDAQRKAVNEAIEDLRSGKCMSRLIQGDVGSGKTLAAAALLWYTVQCGYTAAFMAPTEILSAQHFETLTGFLKPFGITCGLLTGSTKSAEKKALLAKLADGSVQVLIGTHALLNPDLNIPNLALVVTDEQHRFGVNQRTELTHKGNHPHVLVMSATPIPRTLALIIYGDLDISVIDELPPGRQKVSTFAVNESYRQRLNGFIRKQVVEGRQVFVVCPKVEDNENDEIPSGLKSAEQTAALLQETFPDLRILCVHGQMKGSEKDAIMSSFANHNADILVSTTVIEVGVDIPNASLIIIENAERFGLSQLHQLRGRVGRGSHKSWCILVSDSDSQESKERLSVLCRTNDGFKIAEEDLRLRGPGEFFGSRQHGLPELHTADLGADTDLIKRSKDAADRLFREDPGLKRQEHQLLNHHITALIAQSMDTIN